MLRPLSILTACALLSLLTSCAVTFRTTEGTSESFENTTEASIKLTSSTSPDIEDDSKSEKVSKFIKSNFDRLRLEMATGNGEHLETLSVLLDLNEAQKVRFMYETQHHFNQLFLSQHTSPDQLLVNLNKLVAQL